MEHVDRLLKAVPDIFPPYVPEVPVAPHECEECFAIRSMLDGHTWQEVSPAFLIENDGALPLLTLEARQAYLPVWLVAALQDPECEAATMLIIHLQMSGPWHHVSRGQAQFVLECVESIAGRSDWLVDDQGREMIASLQQAWALAAA